MEPAAARRAARLAIGGVAQTREQHRQARAFGWLDDARRDVVYALRMLRRHPITTTTATMSLAIGIGLNAAVFSVVDWVLLRPLPFPASHELVHVFTAGTAPVTGPSGLDYQQFRAFSNATVFRDSAAFSTTTRILAGAGIEPVHSLLARVGGDLFATLGVRPDVGRPFSREEIAGGLPVAVLGHELWRRTFSEDRQIVGRTVSIDGLPYTVIGVMPPHLGYPREAEIWRPLTADERTSDDPDLSLVARLRSGTSAARASAEIATMAQAASNGTRTAWVDDLQRTDAVNVRASLHALFAAAILTLVVACANVAALIGAGAADRAGEMAVRGALGATRPRIFGQLMIESLMLALAGGVLGLLAGHSALRALVAMAPVSVPRLTEISLDSRIVGLGLLAIVLTGMAVGIAPAIRLSGLSRSSVLNRLAWHRATPRPHARRALVFAQVAVAVVLTTGAGLLLRSLHHLVTQDHGFAPDRLVAVRVFPPQSFDGNVQQLFREMAASTEPLPGIEAVAWSLRLPTQVAGLRASLKLAGGGNLSAAAVWRPVSSTYFETVGIPVTAGRRFSPTDTHQAPRVAIVNAALLRLLDGRSPLGVQLTSSLAKAPVTIVGVVGDVTPGGVPDRPAVYVPVEQSPIGEGHLLVSTQGDPRSAIPALTARLREVAPGFAFDRVGRVAQTLEDSRAATRFVTRAAATSAGLALLLSMIGVYGLTAGDVSVRRREIAIRLALGATRRGVLWTMVRPCAVVLGAGTAIGLAGSVSVGPTMASLLHGVAPTDLPTLVGAPVLLIGIGTLSAGIAASRVLRRDSPSALNSD